MPHVMPHWRELLLSVPLLDGIPEAVAVEVAEAGRIRNLDAGTVIFSEGEPATSFFVVFSGSVKLVQLAEDGDAIVFRLLGYGGAFGTVSLLGSNSYPVSAVAVTSASIVQWPAAVMRDFLDQHPRLSLNVLRSVSDRLQALRLQYRQLATEKVERRIARALLTLMQSAGRQVEDGVLLGLPLSREDLAQLTGTTVYTVSRIVSRWEAGGLVRSGRQQLIIRDAETLLSIANDIA
jgi:CRP/FNR family transcriptional regulator, nitrogen oxide reductase regulator